MPRSPTTSKLKSILLLCKMLVIRANASKGSQSRISSPILLEELIGIFVVVLQIHNAIQQAFWGTQLCRETSKPPKWSASTSRIFINYGDGDLEQLLKSSLCETRQCSKKLRIFLDGSQRILHSFVMLNC